MACVSCGVPGFILYLNEIEVGHFHVMEYTPDSYFHLRGVGQPKTTEITVAMHAAYESGEPQPIRIISSRFAKFEGMFRVTEFAYAGNEAFYVTLERNLSDE